jgi:HEAT repeat protein
VNYKKESIRKLKKRIFKILGSPNFSEELDNLLKIPGNQFINSLLSFLYNEDPVVKWNAVLAVGAAVSNIAEDDIESARVIIRRLMWNLNDESGGIGWGSVEAMGEILANNNTLAREYSGILLSYARKDGNFQEHELMQRGVLWAIGRLSQVSPELLKKSALGHILPYLDSGDAVVRGLAAWVSGLLGIKDAKSRLEELEKDESEIQVFINDKLIKRRVRDMAEAALLKIKKEALI